MFEVLRILLGLKNKIDPGVCPGCGKVHYDGEQKKMFDVTYWRFRCRKCGSTWHAKKLSF